LPLDAGEGAMAGEDKSWLRTSADSARTPTTRLRRAGHEINCRTTGCVPSAAPARTCSRRWTSRDPEEELMDEPTKVALEPVTVIAATHQGSYDEIGSVYHRLHEWAQARGVATKDRGFTVFLSPLSLSAAMVVSILAMVLVSRADSPKNCGFSSLIAFTMS